MNSFDPISLLLTLLALYGLAWVLAESKISLPVRNELEVKGNVGRFVLALMECPACFGFWEGLVAGSFVFGPKISAVGFGFAVTASNLLLHAIVHRGV